MAEVEEASVASVDDAAVGRRETKRDGSSTSASEGEAAVEEEEEATEGEETVGDASSFCSSLALSTGSGCSAPVACSAAHVSCAMVQSFLACTDTALPSYITLTGRVSEKKQ